MVVRSTKSSSSKNAFLDVGKRWDWRHLMCEVSDFGVLWKSFFGCEDCGSEIHLWQFSRQLVLCSPVHWSSGPKLYTALAAVVKHNAWYVYKSCVISKRIIFVCCLTVALLVSDTGNLGRFGTGEPYLEDSEFYAKKLRQPGQVNLYIFSFTKSFLRHLLQQALFCE